MSVYGVFQMVDCGIAVLCRFMVCFKWWTAVSLCCVGLWCVSSGGLRYRCVVLVYGVFQMVDCSIAVLCRLMVCFKCVLQYRSVVLVDGVFQVYAKAVLCCGGCCV